MMAQNGEYYGSNGNLNDMTYNFGHMSMAPMTRNVPFPNQLYSEIVNLIKSASKGLIPIYPSDFFLGKSYLDVRLLERINFLI